MEKTDMTKMAISRKGLWGIVAGLLVMVLGFVLMIGGGVKDPQVFNYAMFDFRRLVLAPLLILAGVVLIVIAIMRCPEDKTEKEEK